MSASATPIAFERGAGNFLSAVTPLLDPLLIQLVLAGACLAWHEPYDRSEAMLGLLTFALTFPGAVPYFERRRSLLAEVFASWGLVCFVLLLFGYAGRFLDQFDLRMLLTWGLVTPIAMLASHLLYPRVARALSADYARMAVVVGVNPVAQALVRNMGRAEHLGLRFEGFFDDREAGRLEPDTHGQVLGRLDQVARTVAERGIDVVYITLPMSGHPRVRQLLDGLRDTTASIYFAPDLSVVDMIQARIGEVGGIPVVGVCETPFQGVAGMVKRLMDVVMSALILLLLSPLLALVALAIRLDSPGPIIFRQRRYGLDGRDIVVWKFRSMHVTEDGDRTYRQVQRGDPRVTRVGRLIRKTSIDELPQFVNVLQGRMSIVGPRPHAVAVNEHYRKLISGYMVRHKVRPGITGWAQVNGYRGGDDIESMKTRIQYDLDYLRRWSLSLDLSIIVRTALVVLRDAKAF